jgi:hypothetical protein
MTHEENKRDPFNIGLYIIEAGLVAMVIYAMAVLPALFKPEKRRSVLPLHYKMS